MTLIFYGFMYCVCSKYLFYEVHKPHCIRNKKNIFPLKLIYRKKVRLLTTC